MAEITMTVGIIPKVEDKPKTEEKKTKEKADKADNKQIQGERGYDTRREDRRSQNIGER